MAKKHKIIESEMIRLSEEYYKKTLDTLLQQTTLDKMMNGEIIGYRKKKVTKYLTYTVPWIEKQYDDDYEYGTGEFVGYLITTKTVETKIPIGKEVIEVPIRKKFKPKSISFSRYQPLEEVKESK